MDFQKDTGTGSTRTASPNNSSYGIDRLKSGDNSTTEPPVPETTRVRRLTSSVGKLLEVDPGGLVPTTEVVEQARVNGYDEPESVVRDDVGGVEAITVPSDRTLFGELWEATPPESAGLPPSDTPTDSDSGSDSVSESVESFREWLQERVESDQLSHTSSRKTANRRYARTSDTDRRVAQRYETFSTVLITHVRSRQDGESVVDHAESFYPRSVVSKRRRILRENGCYDGYAGACVLAPKYRESGSTDGHTQSPQTEPEPETHAHTFLWLPGEIDKSAFDFSRVTAPETDVHVSVRQHTGGQNPGAQTGRRATTALPKELGNNLPVLGAQLDARGLAPYAQRWCAELRHGSDGSLETSGIRRWQTLGNFDTLADEQRYFRRLRDGVGRARRLSESVRVD